MAFGNANVQRKADIVQISKQNLNNKQTKELSVKAN